jgi:hypothetical protein
MTEKKDRNRVMAEITLSHVLRPRQDSPVSREQALAFPNQEGRAFANVTARLTSEAERSGCVLRNRHALLQSEIQ